MAAFVEHGSFTPRLFGISLKPKHILPHRSATTRATHLSLSKSSIMAGASPPQPRSATIHHRTAATNPSSSSNQHQQHQSDEEQEEAADLNEPSSSPPPLRPSLDIERAPLIQQQQQPSTPSSTDSIDWIMTTFLFLFPALGGMLFGFDIGASSGALLSMTSPTFSGTSWYDLSSLQSGLVVSLSLAGALGGSAAALVWGDNLGRRKELLFASVLYAAGALTVAVAPTLPVVFAGRVVYGVGIGFAMHAAPAYIAETAPPSVRGLLISLKEALIVGGILAGYAIGYVAVEQVGGWRTMYGAAAPLAAVLAAGMAWLPESPRWLLLSGKGAPVAAAALTRTKGSVADAAAIQMEIEDIQSTITSSSSSSFSTNGAAAAVETRSGLQTLTEVVLQPKYRRPLTIGISLMLFQQITGQPSVLYYAAKIFQDAGFATAGEATGISVLLGLFKLVMTGVAVATVDSWGRRPLLLTGVTGIIGSLLVLGSVQAGVIPFLPEGAAPMVNVVALLMYVGAYQISFGPISWLICGEVFPLRVRGQAIALATLTNFASNFLVSLVLPSLQDAYGPSAMYFTFAAVAVVALGTINSIVPETKGRSLEEIEKLWGNDE